MNKRSTKKESRCSCAKKKKQFEGIPEANVVHLIGSHSHLTLFRPVTLFRLFVVDEI